VWSASRPGRLYSRERPGTHCTGGWVGPGAGLDRCGKSRPTGIRPRTFHPVASRYIDYATAAPLLVFVVGACCDLRLYFCRGHPAVFVRPTNNPSVKRKHIYLYLSKTTRFGLHRPSSGHHCRTFKIRPNTAQLYSQYGIPCLGGVITM
jgi:hypothetical protein